MGWEPDPEVGRSTTGITYLEKIFPSAASVNITFSSGLFGIKAKVQYVSKL